MRFTPRPDDQTRGKCLEASLESVPRDDKSDFACQHRERGTVIYAS